MTKGGRVGANNTSMLMLQQFPLWGRARYVALDTHTKKQRRLLDSTASKHDPKSSGLPGLLPGSETLLILAFAPLSLRSWLSPRRDEFLGRYT